MKDLRDFPTPTDILVLVIGLALFTYVYVGFFSPDPALFKIFPDAVLIWRATQLFLPVAASGAVGLFVAVRIRRMKRLTALQILADALLIVLMVFLVIDIRYGRALTRNTAAYHALLQLKPPLLQNYDPALFNVVCLGGSTTEFRDKSGRDWPSLVEKRLRELDGFKNVKFHNMGKQWYTSQHILVHYLQNVRPYRPQAVIVMENINDLLLNADFSRLSGGTYRNDYGHFTGPMTRVVRYGSYSRFLGGMLQRLWYQKPAQEETVDRFPGLEAYERNIRTLIALARLDGTQVILMTQPNIYKERMTPKELDTLGMLNGESVGEGRKWAYQTVFNGLGQYNDRLRRIAADERVPLIDLERAVPKSLDYFYDDVHYTARAYDLIAKYLSAQLQECLRRPVSQ